MIMAWITSGLSTIWTIVTQCVQFIIGGGAEGTALASGNSLLQLFLVAGLIPVGFGIFRSAKRAARR